VRKFVNTQEAGASFMGKKGTVVAEELAFMGSGGGSAAVDLAPDMSGRLEELGVSSDGTQGILTAGEAEGMAFTGRKVNSGLVEGCNVIVTLVHGVNALLIGSGAGWKVTDNGTQVSHGGNIKVSFRYRGRKISIRRTDRFKEVSWRTVLEGTRSGEVDGIEVEKWKRLRGVIKCGIRVLEDRVVILFGNSLNKGSG
jgi:hypothetical protein